MISCPWSESSATPLRLRDVRTFQVTHPFHALRGQTFELVSIRHNWGAEHVYFLDAAGRLRVLPLAWTSLFPEDPAVVFGAGQSPFRLMDLLELSRLIAALRDEALGQKPAPETPPRPPGGVK